MTAEQLLKKRYKVIADWPKNDDCNVGDILELSAEYGGEQLYRFGEAQSLWSVSDFKQYPHLFKELQWWEDRKPEDMPGYVTWSHGHSSFGKIEKASYVFGDGTPRVNGLNIDCFLPATESDWENYNKFKNV